MNSVCDTLFYGGRPYELHLCTSFYYSPALFGFGVLDTHGFQWSKITCKELKTSMFDGGSLQCCMPSHGMWCGVATSAC